MNKPSLFNNTSIYINLYECIAIELYLYVNINKLSNIKYKPGMFDLSLLYMNV